MAKSWKRPPAKELNEALDEVLEIADAIETVGLKSRVTRSRIGDLLGCGKSALHRLHNWLIYSSPPLAEDTAATREKKGRSRSDLSANERREKDYVAALLGLLGQIHVCATKHRPEREPPERPVERLRKMVAKLRGDSPKEAANWRDAEDFLSRHKQRSNEESGEQKRLRDEFFEHYNKYFCPWDGAWNLLETALNGWSADPTEDDRRKLADAIRRIAHEAHRSGLEENILAAAHRCQLLAEKHPSRESLNRRSVADQAALLLILRVALDDPARTDQLIGELAITHQGVGAAVRSEVERPGKVAAGVPVAIKAALEQQGKTNQPFVPTPLQCRILAALEGRALKKKALGDEACGGEGTRLYRKGGIKELREMGLVDHKHGVGYFRPDAPPSFDGVN